MRAISNLRKNPKRLFIGGAGSPLSHLTPVPQENPKPLPRHDMVLLHFCFNQQAGEQKNESCTCKQRVNREDAQQLVRENRADWLIVKNARAKIGTSLFPRAVVVRRVIIGGKILFSVAPALRHDRRSVKHEAIKAGIRTDARKILEKLVSKGVIPAGMATISDIELDRLFETGPNEEFLTMLTEQGQNALRTKMIGVVLHWWNNILGFHRLDSNAGKFIAGADHGTGALVYEHQTPGGNLSRIAEKAASGDNYSKDSTSISERNADDRYVYGNGHRVMVANHKPSFWGGSWDYSTGADSLQYERRKKQPKESGIERGLKEAGIN